MVGEGFFQHEFELGLDWKLNYSMTVLLAIRKDLRWIERSESYMLGTSKVEGSNGIKEDEKIGEG